MNHIFIYNNCNYKTTFIDALIEKVILNLILLQALFYWQFVNKLNILLFKCFIKVYIYIFMHLADAFIQSDLFCIFRLYIFFFCQYVFPGNWTHNLCAANAMLYHWATVCTLC